MKRHLLDHPRTREDSNLIQKFNRVRRNLGSFGPHESIRSLHRRSHAAEPGNARMVQYARIHRAQS
ncbi:MULTISPECIES: hypothetical protein [Halocynthiibacter]|uniref:Uncharacterized protein n=1 Tax=Halocynthiibacter halioticoli TaxID=2986804 RepID=A0AAE3IWQ9_9RHOB|nr:MULTISPECIES: hypothetical protein [Halocynthiibacter]MCV6823129.1 hypothetical protein [Halocynthiibacter halioticoli]MCW4056130.1 hypothetical protein [Halocynthiibacter sp. SDUM655004]MDE0590894.1 hypothetical protein [Halocynthiibacter sp. C4]